MRNESDTAAVPECRHCHSNNLRSIGYFRPKVGERCRTAIGINCDEDAVRQRVRCRECNKSFTLHALERIEAKPGRPKVSRNACVCGSTSLRRAGWEPDGRQHVRCNECGKEFALELGILATGKPIDTLGRRIPSATSTEHQWQLPSAAEEAAALVRLFETGQCDVAEIRELIAVSASELRCLEFLAANGMLAAANVASIVRFRDEVLLQFNALAAKLGG